MNATAPPPAKSRPAKLQPSRAAPPLRKIVGFEATDYATLGGRVVWVGDPAAADHPRNLWRPRQAMAFCSDTRRLQRGATRCLTLLRAPSNTGLVGWLKSAGVSDGMSGGTSDGGTDSLSDRQNDSVSVPARHEHTEPQPLWLQLAATRLDAVRHALQVNDPVAFERAALRVLGLGPGLTPSGDDFIGGIFFALHHAPRPHWRGTLPAVHARFRTAAASATNVISAALLDDLMDGHSHQALHDLLAALQTEDPARIEAATTALLRIGATSGADMLCGVLLALTTWQDTF